MRRTTRRAFLRELAGTAGAAAAVGLLGGCSSMTQPGGDAPRVYRVGLLGTRGSAPFWDRLTELGYVEGQNLVKEHRPVPVENLVDEDVRASYAGPAAELASIPVDVIVAIGPGIGGARRATTSVPIVMFGEPSDPVEMGFVESLARPGGNITGVTSAAPEAELKRLQLLVEAVPAISKVAVLHGVPRMPADTWESAARSLGIGYMGLSVPTRQLATPEALELALVPAIADGANALLVQSIRGFGSIGEPIVSLAARYHLPAIYPNREWVAGGGLHAYAGRVSDIQRRAADYVDRILRGARPEGLPVELPSRYDLIVNMRTARALGLTFPATFLARVEEVIE